MVGFSSLSSWETFQHPIHKFRVGRRHTWNIQSPLLASYHTRDFCARMACSGPLNRDPPNGTGNTELLNSFKSRLRPEYVKFALIREAHPEIENIIQKTIIPGEIAQSLWIRNGAVPKTIVAILD